MNYLGKIILCCAVSCHALVGGGVSVKKVKEQGQIFTPDYIVRNMLDVVGYRSASGILKKHIIDNSCGDGAFLVEIVSRYIKVHNKKSSDKQKLASELGMYIHGIELDKAAYDVCVARLNRIVADNELPPVNWDVRNADAISIRDYDGKMDYVVGNPPYVRVHNLKDSYGKVKQFSFCDGGMTDLYLLFYEISFNMLNAKGRLCLITASSWLNSLAGANMREFVKKTKSLKAIIDLGHYQAFDATTYTAIALFENGIDHNKVSYFQFGQDHKVVLIADLNYDDVFIANAIYLGTPQSLDNLRNILTNQYEQFVVVKNGFATLADPVFIRKQFPFDEHTIPVIKASNGKWYRAFYPYDKEGKPYSKEVLYGNLAIREYLDANKESLLKGRDESECLEWYLFGRTQALKDVWKKKYAINTVIRDCNSIKLNAVEEGCGVYSGLYILTEISEEKIKSCLFSQEFIDYISMLKKYKSGGYYTFSSKDLSQYLNYKLSKEMCNE